MTLLHMTPLLLCLLLLHTTSSCNNSWESTRCAESACYTPFDPALQSLYLAHPRETYYTRSLSFYSERKELLLSLYIRRDGTAADVKCIGRSSCKIDGSYL